MLKYKVINDFLPPSHFKRIYDLTMGDNDHGIRFRYSPHIGQKLDNSVGYFYNRPYDYPNIRVIRDPIFWEIAPTLMHYGNLRNLIRLQVSCYTKQPTNVKTYPHIDQQYPHNVLLFSVNTNNGYTILDPDGEKIKIPSVENQALIFDGTIWHQAVFQTDTNIRVNINLNF